MELYGLFPKLGWGVAIVRRKDLAIASFTQEETAIKSIVDKKLFCDYQKTKHEQ